MNALKKLFWVSRPVSWVNTAYPFAAGYIVLGGGLDPLLLVGSLFFLIPYNLLMYGINDVFDYESDIRNPRKNSIEGAREQRSFHPVILWSSIGVSLPFVIALLLMGDLASNLILLAVLFFVVAYSLKGLRFKEKPFLDSITSSLHFVGPLVYAWALLGFMPQAWPFIIAMFFWGLASHAFGAVQDVMPDRKGGLASIATIIGAKATVRFSVLLYLAAAILVALQGGLAWYVAFAGLAYVINIIPYWSVSDKKSGQANAAWRRFIWLNYGVGAVVTIVLLTAVLSS